MEILGDMRLWGLAAGVLALVFVGYLISLILREGEGNPKMRDLSYGIRQGAEAFLRREFITLAVFTAVVVLLLAFLIQPKPWVGLAYLFGTLTSALAAFLGMSIATRANARTANAAIRSWARALKVAFSSGAVMGFSVVGLGVLGMAILAILTPESKIWLGFAFGATGVALFLRVGGGIYTKSADVGSDLVGKVEKGIPEDDPRNAAVIADQVGDNVGDVAGMGSDLYESYVSAIAATMVLGVIAFGIKGMMLPLLLCAIGIVASIIGAFFVSPREFRGSFEQQVTKALSTMNRGVWIANILMIVIGFLAIYWYMGWENMGLFVALVAGLICGFFIGQVTEYFTSGATRPALSISRASETGPATTIIQGLAVGMLSTVIPLILVAVTTWVAYEFADLLGIAIASLGMVINLGVLLAMDCYGPIADNSAGIAEMAGLGKEVRERCEALDSVGNTTAATGKGFAIGSAALAALAWIATYFEVAGIGVANIIDVRVLIGLIIGTMMVFLFTSLAMLAVGSGAFEVVREVRRQFREIKGIWEGTATPEYAKCVDITTERALRWMLPSGIAVIVIPLVLGFSLGVEAVAGLITGALLTGFMVAVFMANAGGAWDNAKKYIEAGYYGGKGSEPHKAAVIGDTVGDPLKDTAGPSLNILIKLVGKIAVIFAPLFL
ncbi:sodium-translocating pyrophosphatase [Dehalococcoidales bacterium]|nr:sodium-translocating pyrophosphatase [Dehalococcoidales bacterium]